MKKKQKKYEIKSARFNILIFYNTLLSLAFFICGIFIQTYTLEIWTLSLLFITIALLICPITIYYFLKKGE